MKIKKVAIKSYLNHKNISIYLYSLPIQKILILTFLKNVCELFVQMKNMYPNFLFIFK